MEIWEVSLAYPMSDGCMYFTTAGTIVEDQYGIRMYQPTGQRLSNEDADGACPEEFPGWVRVPWANVAGMWSAK